MAKTKAAAKETPVETPVEVVEQTTEATEETSAITTQEAAGELAPNNLMDSDGFDDIDAGDMSIPYLTLLQDNSPQRKKQHAKFIEGAEEGMILNTVSEELHPTEDGQGLILVPVHIEKATVEWAPRDEGGGGGGFVARHIWNHPDVVRLKKQGVAPNKFVSQAGNILKQTYYLWVLIIDPDMPKPDLMDLRNYAIVSFESTKAAVFQQWVSKAKKATMEGPDGTKMQVPLWRLMLKLGAKFTPGKKGDYFNYTLGFANPSSFDACGWKDSILADDSVYLEAATAFREAIASGIATADTSSEESAEAAASGSAAGGHDDMPF